MLNELQSLGVEFSRDVPMRTKTSFKIGGAAECMLFPSSEAEMQACLHFCAAQGIKPFILGCGSNLLVKDSGLDGIVISTEKLSGLSLADEGFVTCAAGTKLSELCIFAQKNGLSGLEFAYGIPGSAGGAVFMNAGAYGGEMKDVLHIVRFIDAYGQPHTLPAQQLELGYRRSIFMQNGGIVIGLTVQLSPGDPDAIKAEMNATMQKRRDKQPLEFPSAGSTFKRPQGKFAGQLIEQCGLKGRSVGGAQVSEKHAGFIINTGGAMARDVRALIAIVQTIVEHETGVFLEPEILFI